VTQGTSQTWYFTDAKSKLGDLYNILHIPYTAMLLAFVAIGAGVSPGFHVDRLAAALVAYSMGLGIGAHSIDQLEPTGSHYVKRMNRRELAWSGGLGLAGGTAIGSYYALTLTPWLIPLIAVNLFFAFAYPLPSRVAGGLFHNNLSFAFAWGALPFLTSFFANSLTLNSVGAAVCVPVAAAAWTEIRLSRHARSARKEGLPAGSYGRQERALKVLVASTCAAALVLVVGRLLLG